MSLFNLVSCFLTLAVSLGGIAFIQAQQLEMMNKNVNRDYQREAEKERLFLELQPKIPRFGLENLWADWNYLQFIQYFGDRLAREKTGYLLTTEFFTSIVQDDPRFISAILMLSTSNSLYAVSPETTVQLMDQVLQQISPELDPLTPYVWSYKGVDEMLFLGDMKAAQHSYEMAAEWALKTNGKDKEAVAQRNRQTAIFLAENPDSKKAKVAGWSFILSGGLNEETQKLAIQEIISLGGKVTPTPEGGFQVEFPDQD